MTATASRMGRFAGVPRTDRACCRGKFRAYKCSVKQCRSPKGSGVNNAQGHTGPNWMDDPRELMYLATYGPLSHNNGRGARGDAEGAAARAEAEKKRRRRGEQRAGVQTLPPGYESRRQVTINALRKMYLNPILIFLLTLLILTPFAVAWKMRGKNNRA